MRSLLQRLYWFLIGRVTQTERANRFYLVGFVAWCLIACGAYANLSPHEKSKERVYYPVPVSMQYYYQVCMGTGLPISSARDKQKRLDFTACQENGLKWIETRDAETGALLRIIFRNRLEGNALLGFWGIQ